MDAVLIDFLPPEWRADRARRKAWVLRSVVSGVLITAMAGSALAVKARRDDLEARRAAIAGAYEHARSRIVEVEELDRKKGELSERLETLRDVLCRARAAPAVEAVAAACPVEVNLTRLEFGLRDDGLRPRVEVTLEGRCAEHLEVAELMRALKDGPVFDDVSMVLSEYVDGDSSRKKFVLTAQAPGILELAAVEGPP